MFNKLFWRPSLRMSTCYIQICSLIYFLEANFPIYLLPGSMTATMDFNQKCRICVPELTSLTSLRPAWMDGWLTITRKAPARMRKATCLAKPKVSRWSTIRPGKNLRRLICKCLSWSGYTRHHLPYQRHYYWRVVIPLLQLYCTIHSESPCFLPAAKPISFLLSKPKKKKSKKNRAGYDMIWLESRWRRLHVTISSHSQLKFSSLP